MANEFATLELYQDGDTTVIGFGGREVLNQVNVAACREQIADLVKQHQAKVLKFDLSGVRFIPSGMLGLLASLKDTVGKIQIHNPSDDVREVLEITKLNQIFEVQNEATP